MRVIMEWQIGPGKKLVWVAQDPDWEIIDLDKGRIDAFVATASAKSCRVQIARCDNVRNVEVKCEPPDVRWAYRQWLGTERTIVGDVALWEQTFESEQIYP